jgi:hypothetical protein
MTDQRPLPTSPRPDDTFERELRALLRDRAAGTAPARLHETLTDVTRRPAPRPATGWRRPVVSLAAAAAAVLLLAMGFNPVSTWMQAVTGPAASPSPDPRVVTPVPAFDWSTPMVGLTAGRIELVAGGRSIPADRWMEGRNDPGDQDYRTVELEWTADGREQRLNLYFAADATDWWVSEARMYDDQVPDPDWISFIGPFFRTPIGQAFHGDVALTSDRGRVSGEIRMSAATIDPDGLGTGPRTWDGCTLWADRDGASTEVTMEGSSIDRVVELVEAEDLCVLYRWTYPVGPGQSFGETWCTPPPSGRVRFVRPDEQGELVVFVDDAVVRTPRRQPVTGWGCDGVITADLEAPSSPLPVEDRPFSIDNGHVWLTADRFELSHRGEVIRGPVISGSAQPNEGTLRMDKLEASWFDEDRRVGLTLEFRNDGERWWVTDGTISARGMSWAQLDLPQVSAAMGEAWTGDLDLRLPLMRLDGTSRPTGERLHLVVDNLSVQPFRGTLPRTMTGCVPVVDTTRTAWRTDPTRRGQPLATKGIVGLPTEKAAGVLKDLGYCYLFDRRLTADPTLGPSGILETWCDAPPGEVSGLRYGRGGEVHLIVLTQIPKGTPKRPSPVLGFGCQEGTPAPTDPPLPTPAPTTDVTAIPPLTPKAFTWDTGTIRIAADDVSLAIGDREIHPAPNAWGGVADDQNGRQQITIPIGDDAEARITFTSDGMSWFLYGAEIYADILQGGAPLSTAGITAPLGAPFTGDLAITGTATGVPGGATVTLRLDGAEIAAYRPVVARTLRDCQPPASIRARSDNPSLPGEPLDSLGLVGAPASMAADVMQRLGYCYTFSVKVQPRELADGAKAGGSERWCDTPDGTVTRAMYGESGEIWFEVEPSSPLKARPQPAVGWGCLSDVPGYGLQQQEAP